MKQTMYQTKLNYYEGIITAVDDASVTIDLKGRLGWLKLPRRMVITDQELAVGLEVAVTMSFPEVIAGQSGGSR